MQYIYKILRLSSNPDEPLIKTSLYIYICRIPRVGGGVLLWFGGVGNLFEMHN